MVVRYAPSAGSIGHRDSPASNKLQYHAAGREVKEIWHRGRQTTLRWLLSGVNPLQPSLPLCVTVPNLVSISRLHRDPCQNLNLLTLFP